MKMRILGFILLYLSMISDAKLLNLVQVDVEEGALEGEIVRSCRNNPFYSFKGIPYAAPPIGALRFKAPRPPLPWSGIRSATSHGSKCPQRDIFSDENIPGDEDCLFLNVYTPEIDPEAPLPVMVFIHGGGYKSGSGDDDFYGPSILMDYGIVLVTINYRLEVLGFLCLENEEVPGNAGMKDQVAALRWVQKNIKKFGGDPDNVTIFGQSAGGASVAYHILSPLSSGLFQRAISMSGVPFADFSTFFRPRERAFILGKQLGIATNDSSVLLEYLQSLPSDALYEANPNLLILDTITNNKLKMYHFVPVVENIYSKTTFLSRDPISIIKDRAVNEVDIMISSTDKEALVFIDIFASDIMPIYDSYHEMLVPTKMLRVLDSTTILDISNIIRDHYFSNSTIDVNVIREFVNFLTDSVFTYDLVRFTKSLPEIPNKTKYMYRFSTVSGRNYYGNRGLKYDIRGVAHLDDLLYMFEAKALDMTLEVDSEEYKLVDRVCTLFTNFAKYGNPTPDDSLEVQWPQYDSEREGYMEIGNILLPGTHVDKEAINFWKSVFDYASIPFYP